MVYNKDVSVLVYYPLVNEIVEISQWDNIKRFLL